MLLSSLPLEGASTSLTSFFSLAYTVGFLPLCIVVYSLIPQRFKKYYMLAAGYGFFWLISGKLIVYLMLSTLSMYGFGLWLNHMQEHMRGVLANTDKEERKAVKRKHVSYQRAVVFLAVLLHIGLLLTLKYSSFFATNINTLFAYLGVSIQLAIPKFLMPIGISFFTLQALSYIFDVHRGVTKADKNIGRVALFIAFFPQIVEGPICRYNQTAEQLWNIGPIQYMNLCFGLQRILFGMMKKIVIADRLSPFVDKIFAHYTEYDGGVIAIAAVFYTIQLYMDFSGSMDAVIGTAQIFGVKMPENFQRPFFSKTISEFWKRWHITLGTWFKDYIFYPVTTAKPMKNLTSSARKKIGNHYGPLLAGSVALFCVWICNGLWHGSAWNYIFFGMYHFAFILGGNIIGPLVKWTNKKLKINSEAFWYRALQMVRTTIILIIGELFFRAAGFRTGFHMFEKMITQFSFASINDELLIRLGIDRMDVRIVAITLIIVFAISVINEKGISVREVLARQRIWVRWTVLYALILFIVIFGAYGFGYTPVDPLYAQF